MREGNFEDRLRLYDEILRGSEYLKAIEETEAEAARKGWMLQPDTRLYLRAMAPVLTAFTGWVLKQAEAAGKKRLYFLSRDGYQMYLTAKRLVEKQRIPLECRYLYVSRYALRTAGYHLDLNRCLDLICVGGIDVTLEKILRRGGLTPEESAEIIVAAGWQDRYRDRLNYRQIQALKKTLSGQPRLFTYIDRHSREKYINAIGYLRQEELLSGREYAVVDSGWTGTCQQSLARLIHSVDPGIRVEGYYFGLYELPAQADPSTYHSWYFAPGKDLRRKAYFSNSLFETVCSAPEGMTVEYLTREGNYLPRTVRDGNPNREQIGRNLEALEQFLGRLALAEGAEETKKAGIAGRLFELFMAKPGGEEVDAYGDSLFSDDLLDGNYQEAAAKLTKKQIREQRFFNRILIFFKIKRTEIRESAWIEGSVARLGVKGYRQSLWHVRFYKYMIYARKHLNALRKQKR